MTSQRKVDLESELISISAQLEFLAEAIPGWCAGEYYEATDNGRSGIEALLSSLSKQLLALSEVASDTGAQAND